MFTRRFWTLATERMIKTFAQTLASVLVAGGAGLFTAGWTAALSTAGMAAVVSVLTSIGSLGIGPADSPSVVTTEPAAAQPVPATPVAAILPVPPSAPQAAERALPAAA